MPKIAGRAERPPVLAVSVGRLRRGMGMILPSWGVAFTPPCLWLVYQARGSYPTLVLPGHSTALTPADGGCMDFPSVAVPWSPCFSPFAWRGLQPLVGPPAQHPRAESPLERHLISAFLPRSAWIRGINQIPNAFELGKCSCLSASCSAWIRGISWIPQCS